MLRPIASASTAPSPSPPPIKFISHPRPNLHKPFKLNHPANTILQKQFTPSIPTSTKFLCCCTTTSHFAAHFDEPSGSNWDLGDDEIDDEIFPWEGAIMYRRNGAVSHLEYCTTLERLGLGKVSSGLSRTRASDMGLRLVKPVTDYPDGTPVLISADVTRRKQKLRLDGIVRTVISLYCNRCGEPAAQSVYSDFTLLLCEEPIVESETINLGTIFGEKSETFETGDDDDALIDIDDQLYFPSEEKSIDILCYSDSPFLQAYPCPPDTTRIRVWNTHPVLQFSRGHVWQFRGAARCIFGGVLGMTTDSILSLLQVAADLFGGCLEMTTGFGEYSEVNNFGDDD